MVRLEAEPLVEALRIDAGMMREQFDQLAAAGAGLRNRIPLRRTHLRMLESKGH